MPDRNEAHDGALRRQCAVGTFVTPGSYLTVFMTYQMKQLDTTKVATARDVDDLAARGMTTVENIADDGAGR